MRIDSGSIRIDSWASMPSVFALSHATQTTCGLESSGRSEELDQHADRAQEREAGAVVNVRGEDGRGFGTGYFNPKSLIAVRLLAEDCDVGRLARSSSPNGWRAR